jgi:hypothetical protein
MRCLFSENNKANFLGENLSINIFAVKFEIVGQMKEG